MLSTNDMLHLGILWTIDILAIIVNLLLIATIILRFSSVTNKAILGIIINDRTPKHLRPYSIFLLNNAFIDLTSAIASAFGGVRYSQLPNSETYFFQGCFKSRRLYDDCCLPRSLHTRQWMALSIMSSYPFLFLFIPFWYVLERKSQLMIQPCTLTSCSILP